MKRFLALVGAVSVTVAVSPAVPTVDGGFIGKFLEKDMRVMRPHIFSNHSRKAALSVPIGMATFSRLARMARRSGTSTALGADFQHSLKIGGPKFLK
jgi:hypothetical protein